MRRGSEESTGPAGRGLEERTGPAPAGRELEVGQLLSTGCAASPDFQRRAPEGTSEDGHRQADSDVGRVKSMSAGLQAVCANPGLLTWTPAVTASRFGELRATGSAHCASCRQECSSQQSGN